MLKSNEYFEGNVKSIGFTSDMGETSVGVMDPGEYEFSTGKPEMMSVIIGEMEVTLPGEEDVKSIKGGESFHVPGNSKFKVSVKSGTAYLCNYIGE